MKKLTLALAAIVSMNTSFAFAGQMTRTEVAKIKVQIAQEKLKRDQLLKIINQSLLKVQALEDVKTPGLASFYREHKENLLTATTAGSYLMAAALIFAKKGNPSVGPNWPVVLTLIGAGTISALSTNLIDQESLKIYQDTKSEALSLSEEQQGALYIQLFENIDAAEKELKLTETAISSLEEQI